MNRPAMRLLCSPLALLALTIGPYAAADCPKFAGGVDRGLITAPGLDEASGLAASRRDPNVLWAHNDSGSAPILYALGKDGSLLAMLELEGASNVDWEDMAIGPGPDAARDYLYIADIGDNGAVRSELTIYRAPEPSVVPGVDTPIPGAVPLRIRYPDGAHDAETLMVEPESGDLYIITKSLTQATSRIYRFAAPHDEGATTTLELVGTHTFPSDVRAYATTGGDISNDGSMILVRAYTRAYLWPREPGETVAEAMGRAPCAAPLEIEVQGEAIAFEGDGTAYFTTSERAGFGPRPLRRHARIDTTAQCRLDLDITNTGAQLDLDFEIGSVAPAFWAVWVAVPGTLTPVLWTVLPAIDPPIQIPTFPIGSPPSGPVAVLSALIGGGFSCWDWEVVDTGTP